MNHARKDPNKIRTCTDIIFQLHFVCKISPCLNHETLLHTKQNGIRKLKEVARLSPHNFIKRMCPNASVVFQTSKTPMKSRKKNFEHFLLVNDNSRSSPKHIGVTLSHSQFLFTIDILIYLASEL